MKDLLKKTIKNIGAEREQNPDAPDGTYRDAEGFLCCSKCGTRKEAEITVGDEKMKVPQLCQCMNAERRKREAEEAAEEYRARCEYLRREGIADPLCREYTFENDDKQNAKISETCRRYVQNWERMQEDNIGVLLYGPVGTGKSFMAGAIANALIDMQVRAMVTSFPRILNNLQSLGGDRQTYIDRLIAYDLLVIDDLGAERDTSYSLEQVYGVIDSRYRSQKPLIITMNMTLAELQSPPTLDYARIYDRVLELCPIRLKLVGESRRTESAAKKRDRAREILGI